MYIANITMPIEDTPKQIAVNHRSFGRIWYSSVSHKMRLYLMGWRQGRFIGKPYVNLVDNGGIMEPPYIEGEITALLNEHKDRNSPETYRPVWVWCGHIQTTQSDDGKDVTYWGDLEIMPFKGPGTWDRGFRLIINSQGNTEDDYVRENSTVGELIDKL